MAIRPNRGTFRLRIEPYDPNARDADNDGIVQEGTAWERPAGTRVVDLFRNEISRGQTAFQRSSQFRIVDKTGKEIRYTPTYERGIIPGEGTKPSQTSSPLGLPSLRELGLRPIGEGRTLGDKHRAYTERRRAAIQRMPEDVLLDRQKASARARIERFFVGRELTDEERRLGQNTTVNAIFWATTLTPLGQDIGAHINNALTGVIDADATDALNDLREFYEAAGMAGLAIAFEGLRARYNAGKEKVNEWTEQAAEWMRRQGVRAGEISDNLKAAMQKAAADILALFRRDDRPGANNPMVFTMTIENLLRPEDFDIPEPPLSPEELGRRTRLSGLLDEAFARPKIDGVDWASFDVISDVETNPRQAVDELSSSLDLLEALWTHKNVSPDVAFEGIDVDEALNRVDSFVRSKYHFPSISYGTYNQPPEVISERLSAQREAFSDLVDRVQTSNRLINAPTQTMDIAQATEAYDALKAMRESDVREDITNFYRDLPISDDARQAVEGPMRELALLHALKRRFAASEQEQRLATRIRDLRKQEEIAERVDMRPGLLKSVQGGLATRELDPRLGSVSKFDGLDIMPTPQFKRVDETSASLSEAIENIRRGGSMSEVPNTMWRDVLNGASSEKDIDLDMPFKRIIPVEGANGDLSIFLLRDKEGNPTPHGWVIKGTLDDQTDSEVIGWNLAVAHGVSPYGAGYDGEGALQRGTFSGSDGTYAVIPFAYNHVDAKTMTDLDVGSKYESAYSADRLKNAEFEGNPQLFAAFLHSYLTGMTDRHDGNTLVAEHNGQAIVVPIDMTDFGKTFSMGSGDSPLTYAHFEYGADPEIVENLRDYRRTLPDDERKMFDEQIATVYDSMLARAQVIADMDSETFANQMLGGSNPRRRNVDEARTRIQSLHDGYRANVEQMRQNRDTVIAAIADDSVRPPSVSSRQPMPVPKTPPPRPTSPEAQKVIKRNNEVKLQLKAAGGAINNDIDEAYKKREADMAFGNTSIETDREAFDRRRSTIIKDLAGIRQALKEGPSTDQTPGIMDPLVHGPASTKIDETVLRAISPQVRQLIETKTDDELIEIMERRAMEFHRSLDKRPRVRIPEALLLNFFEEGRYKTTHEATSAHSGPQVRRGYETYLGVPSEADPELRPASAFMVHPDWEKAQVDIFRESNPTLSEEELKDRLFSDAVKNPNGNVAIYGGAEIVLRPEVAGRTKYGRGDSLGNFLRPVDVESQDTEAVMHAINWAGGRDADRGPISMANLLQSEIDGNFGSLNVWHPLWQEDGQRNIADGNSATRSYFEALVFGSFTTDDVEEIKIPASTMEVLGKVADKDGALTEDGFKSRLTDPDHLRSLGFTEEQIDYIISKKDNAMFPTWFTQYKTWKRREKAKEVLDKSGVNVNIIQDLPGAKNPFELSSYRGSEGAKSIDEVLLKRTREDIQKFMDAEKAANESPTGGFDEGPDVA